MFPVFLAGVFTTDHGEKEAALSVMTTIGPRSVGPSAERVGMMLRTIYEKQRSAIAQFGEASSVDWMEEMESNGERLIVMGL